MAQVNDNYDDELRYSRRLAFVPRWVVMPTIRRQSVAEHAYAVTQTTLWLVHRLCFKGLNLNRAEFLLELIGYALNHDNDEAISGDTPSPNKKRRSANDASLIEIIVKIADLLEAVAFVKEEQALGNRYAMNSVYYDLKARLTPWWLLFEWDETTHGECPEVDELIDLFIAQVVPKIHPVMEQL